jgi:hypothetical protein
VVWREVDDVRGLRARIACCRRDGGDDEREEDGETRAASPRHGAGRKQIGPAAAAAAADGAEDNCNQWCVGPVQGVDHGFATVYVWSLDLTGEKRSVVSSGSESLQRLFYWSLPLLLLHQRIDRSLRWVYLLDFFVVELIYLILKFKFDMCNIFMANYFLMRCDVFIDSEILLVIEFLNLKIRSSQSFKSVHKSMVCVHVFIRISTHTCIKIYVCTVFFKKELINL